MTNLTALNAILISSIPGLGLRVTNGDTGSDLTAQVAHRLAVNTTDTGRMTVIPGLDAGELAEVLAETLGCEFTETITGNAATVRPQQAAPYRDERGLTVDERATLQGLGEGNTVRNLNRLARLRRLGLVEQQGRSWTLSNYGGRILGA